MIALALILPTGIVLAALWILARICGWIVRK